MDDEPEPPQGRRREISQRIGAIRTRIDELEAQRQDNAPRGTFTERFAAAQRHAAASQAAAQEAMAASARALRRAADAHERLALYHERAAATGTGDNGVHEQQAAVHRAAAAADTQRAEHLCE